ncbi:hypothetical protein ABIE49_007062 [Bradyrhizobium sp. OAE829]
MRGDIRPLVRCHLGILVCRTAARIERASRLKPRVDRCGDNVRSHWLSPWLVTTDHPLSDRQPHVGRRSRLCAPSRISAGCTRSLRFRRRSDMNFKQPNHVIASEAKQSILSSCGGMDCFASLANDGEIASRSRDTLRPRFAGNLRLQKFRGRRECRMRAAPAVSCAIVHKNAAHEHTGQRRTSDIPCAMALRLIARSPR